MNEENCNGKGEAGRHLEFRAGCPACEHSDPELERELRVFADLLLDIYVAKREEMHRLKSEHGFDNESHSPKLEIKVDNKSIN